MVEERLPAIYNSPALQAPPGVVFYRDSLFNPHARHAKPATAKCNCLAECNGDLAEVQCMSCAVFHPRKVALYCGSCFRKRHPPYRAQHRYVPISQFEDVEHVKQMRQANIEIERSVAEGQLALDNVRNKAGAMHSLRYSEATEHRVRQGARQLLDLEKRLMSVRQWVKESVVFSTSEHNCTVAIQALVRGFICRRRMSYLLANRLLRAWNKQLRKWFVHDSVSHQRRTYLPHKVHSDHRHALRLVWHGDHRKPDAPRKWAMCYFTRPNRRKQAMDADKAATVIQCFFWCILARHVALDQASKVYIRKQNEQFNRIVYVNTNAALELWNKPLVLCNFEPS